MTTDTEIEAKFWKALRYHRTIMLGLDGKSDGHARPMTAQFENTPLQHTILPPSPFHHLMRSVRKSGSTTQSVLAGIKLLLGADPKEKYKDKVAEVDFR